MITIITKWYCPYCNAAVKLLNQLGIEHKNTDITNNPELYSQVKEISGSQTVPQVFIWDIHGKFLGGYTELTQLHKSGELEKLLK